MGEAKTNKKTDKIEENEGLKLALLATQIESALTKQQLYSQNLEQVKQQLQVLIKQRDEFQAQLIAKYGIDIEADVVDLETLTIRRGALKAEGEQAAAPAIQTTSSENKKGKVSH